MKTFLLLAMVTVGQGEAFEVRVPDEPSLERVTVEWAGSTHALARGADGPATERAWAAWFGADLDTPTGLYESTISLAYSDGTAGQRSLEVVVEERSYRESHLTVEGRFVRLSAEDQARANREALEINQIYSTTTPEALWTGTFVVPIEGVSQGSNFGHRRFFNGEPRAPHSGADLRAPTGTPVRAANAGRVALAQDLFYSGNAVFVDHGMGVYSVYLHLSEIGVQVGERIAKGQLIGMAGATGRVTGPHLHWGVRIHGARVDPFTLVQ